MRKNHDKLVRDGIPSHLAAAGVPFETRVAGEGERERLLLAKLSEEVEELRAARSDDEVADEIADILEVAFALAAVCEISESDVTDRRIEKREARGGFDDGIVLLWTEDS
jgi:predicted house-cleaning noncanonical NTP pyrophosphatase (MazG superfamily)